MELEIAQAIALVTAEYDLPPFTEERIDLWMQALSKFPPGTVQRSVAQHLQTNRFKPQLADIVAGCAAQLDGNWLGAEEAFALIPKDEYSSGVLTNEIAEAAATVASLMAAGDMVAARMGFKEAYNRLVGKAKLEGRAPVYFPSFGTDPVGRVAALTQAVQKGQLALDTATRALPEHAHDIVAVCGPKDHPLLAAPSPENRQRVKLLLSTLKAGS